MENNMKMTIAGDVLVECPNCDRKFSYGKGLENRKRDHEAMEASSATAASKETSGQKPTFPCPICPQLFSSEKALHGHMRVHSDRGWKGMIPPTEAPPTPAQDGGYVCECGRSIKTYEAVEGGDADTSPLEQSQADGVAGESRKKLKRWFPFDLNELPPPDENDGDVEIKN